MDIFTYYFFIRALIAGILIGIMAPLIGMFIVLRRLSMIGDTLAHVSIAGVALGFLINVYPLGMGLLFTIAAAFAIEKLRKDLKGYAELSLAIMLSGGVALLAIFSTIGKGFNMNVHSYLFGNIVALDNLDLVMVVVVTLIVLLVVSIYHKELFLVTFDEDAASVSGLRLQLFNVLITVLTALVVSVAIKIVGALLVSALITIPIACSLVIGRGFKQTIWIAIAFSEVAIILGFILSGLFDLATGGTIVLLLIGLLVLSLGAKRLIRF